MKENKTPPKYWFIKVTEETLDSINKVRAKRKENNKPIKLTDCGYYGESKKYSYFGGISLETIEEENLLELTLKEFKYYFLEEEFTFPEKWCILATEENIKEISDFFVKLTNGHSCYKGDIWINWYFNSHCLANIFIYNYKIFTYCSSQKREGFEEISIEQFREHVLKQPKTMKPYKKKSEVTYEMITTHPYFKTLSEKELFEIIGNGSMKLYDKLEGNWTKDKAEILFNKLNNKSMQKLIVPITDVLEIHKIACSSWKTKLVKYLERTDSNQNVSFTQIEINEMFDAATSDQKPVLERIFGKQWDKIKTGSIVMLKEANDQRIGGNNNVDYNKPFDVVFWKTPYSIDCGNRFKKAACYESVSTFHQNEKYIRFDAGVHTDYITEVIEY